MIDILLFRLLVYYEKQYRNFSILLIFGNEIHQRTFFSSAKSILAHFRSSKLAIYFVHFREFSLDRYHFREVDFLRRWNSVSRFVRSRTAEIRERSSLPSDSFNTSSWVFVLPRRIRGMPDALDRSLSSKLSETEKLDIRCRQCRRFFFFFLVVSSSSFVLILLHRVASQWF